MRINNGDEVCLSMKVAAFSQSRAFSLSLAYPPAEYQDVRIPTRICRRSAAQGRSSVRHRNIVAAIFSVTLVCVAGCSTQASIPLESSTFGELLLVPVTINGANGLFLLDTGTTNTVLAKRFADRIGLNSHAVSIAVDVHTPSSRSTRDMQLVPIRSFRLGQIRAKRNSGEAVVMDLARISDFAQGEIDGIVGNATLESAAYELDVRNRVLLIGKAYKFSDQDQAIPLRRFGHKTFVPVSINGKTFELLLDTGSTRSYISPHLLQELDGVSVDCIELRGVSVDASNKTIYERINVAVSFGKVTISQFPLLVGEPSRVGLDLLQHGTLIVSPELGQFQFREKLPLQD